MGAQLACGVSFMCRSIFRIVFRRRLRRTARNKSQHYQGEYKLFHSKAYCPKLIKLS